MEWFAGGWVKPKQGFDIFYVGVQGLLLFFIRFLKIIVEKFIKMWYNI